jgi:hypothetical protein
MKNLSVSLSAALVAVATLGAAAFAAPTKMPATMTCPACKMPMGQKKTAAAPIAVPMKGTTYYCCAGCAAGKAMAKKAMKPAHEKMSKMKAAPAASK